TKLPNKRIVKINYPNGLVLVPQAGISALQFEQHSFKIIVSLRHCYSGLQPSDEIEVVRSVSRGLRNAQRHPDIYWSVQLEPATGDSDDRVLFVSQLNHSAYNVSVGSESLTPRRLAEYCHSCGIRHHVASCEATPQFGFHTKYMEEIRCDS